MNRSQRSAIVLLLASAAAAYEEEAQRDPNGLRPVDRLDVAREADVRRRRRLVKALHAWALGRKHRISRVT